MIDNSAEEIVFSDEANMKDSSPSHKSMPIEADYIQSKTPEKVSSMLVRMDKQNRLIQSSYYNVDNIQALEIVDINQKFLIKMLSLYEKKRIT